MEYFFLCANSHVNFMGFKINYKSDINFLYSFTCEIKGVYIFIDLLDFHDY